MRKKKLSVLSIFVLSLTFIFAFTAIDQNVYAGSKKYNLPKEIYTEYLDDEDSIPTHLSNIKYDKYGNVKSYTINQPGEKFKATYTTKYRDKKGTIASVTAKVCFSGTSKKVFPAAKKTYDKKGRISKTKWDGNTYTFTKGKKGTIKKVKLNGKKYYEVKSIKYHKNGFVSKVTYNNGNVNNYNSNGFLTSVKVKNGPKYTYKYTKKNGKVVKLVVKCDGKNYKKVTYKYGKSTTKDVWKLSCIIGYGDGGSNAFELYPKSPISGETF